MSLSSLSSLASTAFDTARTTFKAVADAAVPPANTASPTPDAPAPPAAASPAPDTAAAPKPVKGQRHGTLLDAYA